MNGEMVRYETNKINRRKELLVDRCAGSRHSSSRPPGSADAPAGCPRGARGASAAEAGYGPLQPDLGGIVELPKGFQCRIISPAGTKLSNGVPVPSDFDGMAAFRGARRGTTLLVRNHEVSLNDGASRDNEPVEGSNPYDANQIGGTSAVVVDNDSRRALRDFVTSSGQGTTNCAGGATP